MASSLAIRLDNTLPQIDAQFAAHRLSKINFSNPDNIDAFVLREYSRLHLNMKGQHVFAERDSVWARMDIHSTGEVVHTIFSIKHDELSRLSSGTTVHRHDAIIIFHGMSETGEGKADLKAKDSTLSVKELLNMPDMFFRPRFKGRAGSQISVAQLFRPTFERLRSLFGPKIGLQ